MHDHESTTIRNCCSACSQSSSTVWALSLSKNVNVSRSLLKGPSLKGTFFLEATVAGTPVGPDWPLARAASLSFRRCSLSSRSSSSARPHSLFLRSDRYFFVQGLVVLRQYISC